MDVQKNIWSLTALLAFVAGYCDATTFVSGDSTFSAHITGNFIVFAYQIIHKSDGQTWLKLLTFPMFIFAVIAGGAAAHRLKNHYKLLLYEGGILLLSGILSKLPSQRDHPHEIAFMVVILTVFAMGLQNTFGKLYSKETFGPTTMMTGNVTQAVLSLEGAVASKFTDEVKNQSFVRQCVSIFSFLIGCFAGAVFADNFGLLGLAVPGVAIFLYYFAIPKI